MSHNFKELNVWKRAKDLAVQVYLVTKQFPKEEIFGLTNQIRRSSVSISSNIAEGCGRNSVAQLNNYLNISMGSASELETQLLIAIEIGYGKKDQLTSLIKEVSEIQKMINGLQRSLKK